MTTHGSATLREETPHETETTNTIISNALKRRAQSVINDTSINPQWRNIVRYALETNDPWLGDLVRRADAGEPIIDCVDFSLEPKSQEDDSSEEKIEALAEIICRSGDEPAAALFVLMGILENSTHPKLLAKTVKHIAFTRCGEANLYRMVDAQLEAELLAPGKDLTIPNSVPTRNTWERQTPSQSVKKLTCLVTRLSRRRAL